MSRTKALCLCVALTLAVVSLCGGCVGIPPPDPSLARYEVERLLGVEAEERKTPDQVRLERPVESNRGGR